MAASLCTKFPKLDAIKDMRHRHQRQFSAMRRHAGSKEQGLQDIKFLSVEEVQNIATSRGLSLSVKTLGPAYRIVCREGCKDGQILGYTNGFIVPFASYMHCETLQVFSKRTRPQTQKAEPLRIGVLGLGVILGVATFAFGNERGCQTAEILAINDDDYTAKRLLRYYAYFGFTKVKEVESTDLVDLLIWGGVGTKMTANVQDLLKRWGSALLDNKKAL